MAIPELTTIGEWTRSRLESAYVRKLREIKTLEEQLARDQVMKERLSSTIRRLQSDLQNAETKNQKLVDLLSRVESQLASKDDDNPEISAKGAEPCVPLSEQVEELKKENSELRGKLAVQENGALQPPHEVNSATTKSAVLNTHRRKQNTLSQERASMPTPSLGEDNTESTQRFDMPDVCGNLVYREATAGEQHLPNQLYTILTTLINRLWLETEVSRAIFSIIRPSWTSDLKQLVDADSKFGGTWKICGDAMEELLEFSSITILGKLNPAEENALDLQQWEWMQEWRRDSPEGRFNREVKLLQETYCKTRLSGV